MSFKGLLLSICMSVFVVQASAASLTKINVTTLEEQCLLSMEFDSPVKAKVFSLENPIRLVVDIPHGEWKAGKVKDENTWYRSYRYHADDNKMRLVFDLKASWLTSITQSAGNRKLAVTLTSATSKPTSIKLPKAASLHKTDKSKASIAKQVPAQNLKPIVVVIDPGHGGKDPGAIGKGRKKEKDIVLAIAQQVAKEINQTFGYKAVLTRKGDYYISLRERLNIARRSNADMFISIHADAYKNHKAHGASVFALSERGATSEAARWLAEKENSSELMGGVKLDDKGSVLRSVLLDLSQTATTGAGLEIGAEVLSEMKKVTPMHKGRVEQAAFVVLKSPDIPSLLIETGFVSNQGELKRLVSPGFQKKIAKSIAKGVSHYFSRRPVRGSIIEASLHGGLKHVVQSGDSLSRLAKKYNRTIAGIKSANQMSSDSLKVGQVLLIPS